MSNTVTYLEGDLYTRFPEDIAKEAGFDVTSRPYTCTTYTGRRSHWGTLAGLKRSVNKALKGDCNDWVVVVCPHPRKGFYIGYQLTVN